MMTHNTSVQPWRARSPFTNGAPESLGEWPPGYSVENSVSSAQVSIRGCCYLRSGLSFDSLVSANTCQNSVVTQVRR